MLTVLATSSIEEKLMSQNSHTLRNLIIIAASILLLLVFISETGFINTSSLTLQTPPSGHTNVASQVSVVNTGAGVTFSYDPVFIRSGSTPALNVFPLSFAATGQVPYSLWEYRSDPNDGSTVYAFMIIFGPDNSGINYFVEVSRVSPSALTIGYPSGSQSFGSNGNDGYMYFEVTPRIGE